ncbi:ATP synthase F1 subunit delta [Blattabacterium cuenoti]|uniref:ATP synthase F1 subunit delta n=1 Tax=Blattabacterium cuenoti TaxID=1653831 RepID=UPI00163B7EDE|nr:ATP synthase F1 subunit delta [Blattabacterium cuenoti]
MFSNKKVIKHYARVFFEFSKKKNNFSFNKIKKAFSLFCHNIDIKRIILSSLLNSEKKIIILKKIFYSFDPFIFQFIQLLILHEREFLLREIFLEYINIYEEEKKGFTKCTIISAIPLSIDMKKVISHKMKIFTKKKEIHILNQVDPSIIGGFLFRIGYKEWDFSIKKQFFCIKKIFKN